MAHLLVRNIGGEFYSPDIVKKPILDVRSFGRLFLSGRTALEHILRDICVEGCPKTVCMPSYCCDSMITPFLLHHIKVYFYDVFWMDGKICGAYDSEKKYDIVLVMNYFGYYQEWTAELAIDAKRNGSIVIQDVTHSLFGEYQISEADYVYGSLRKWTMLYSGGFAVKRVGKWLIPDILNCYAYDTFIWKRKLGMDLRRQFMQGKAVSPEIFLQKFVEAEVFLDSHYEGGNMDVLSWRWLRHLDVERIKTRRKKNADDLYYGLKDILPEQMLLRKLSEVPLMVPLFLQSKDIRDKLQAKLKLRSIFCPIHWPLAHAHDGLSTRGKGIYEIELSIPCDQRYMQDDMMYVVRSIQESLTGLSM